MTSQPKAPMKAPMKVGSPKPVQVREQVVKPDSEATAMTVGSSVEPLDDLGLGLALSSPLPQRQDGVPFNGRGPLFVNEAALERQKGRTWPLVVLVGARAYMGVADAESARKRVMQRVSAAAGKGEVAPGTAERMRGIANGNFWIFAERASRAANGLALTKADAMLTAWDRRVVPSTPMGQGLNMEDAAFVREMRSFELGLVPRVPRETMHGLMDVNDPAFWLETEDMTIIELIDKHIERMESGLPKLTGTPEQVTQAEKIRKDVLLVAEHLFGGDGDLEARVQEGMRSQAKAEWWISQEKHGHGVQSIALSSVMPYLKSETVEGFKAWKFDPDFKEAMRLRLRLASWCLELEEGREVFDVFLKENTVRFWKNTAGMSLPEFLDCAAQRRTELEEVPIPTSKKKTAQVKGQETVPFAPEGAYASYLDGALPLL